MVKRRSVLSYNKHVMKQHVDSLVVTWHSTFCVRAYLCLLENIYSGIDRATCDGSGAVCLVYVALSQTSSSSTCDFLTKGEKTLLCFVHLRRKLYTVCYVLPTQEVHGEIRKNEVHVYKKHADKLIYIWYISGIP